MNYGKLKALTILGVPLLLTLSFILASAALAEAASPGPGARGLGFSSHAGAGHGTGLGPRGFNATSAVTGSLTVTGVAVTDITATSALITWSTDEPSNSTIRYGTSKDALGLSATNPVTGNAHGVGLASLTPATQYFFEVESTDGEGDTAVDNNNGDFYDFTTLEAELARRAFVGTVAGDPGETVTLIQQGTEEEVTIILPDDFSLRTPGGPRAGSFEDGARVVILSQRAGEDWVALWVLVKPVKPNLPIVGVVTGVGPTSLSVLDPKGNSHLLRLDTQIGALDAGEVVTVFPGNSNRARGVVRAEEVRNRMQKQLEEITGGEGPAVDEQEQQNRGRRASALIQGLENHGNQQLELFDNALQHAPDNVKDRIREGKSRAEKGIENARSAVGRARGRLNQPEPGNGNGVQDGDKGPGKSNRGQGKGPGENEGPGNGTGRGNSRGTDASPSGGSDDSPGNSGDRGNAGGPGAGPSGGSDDSPGNSGGTDASPSGGSNDSPGNSGDRGDSGGTDASPSGDDDDSPGTSSDRGNSGGTGAGSSGSDDSPGNSSDRGNSGGTGAGSSGSDDSPGNSDDPGKGKP